MADISQAMQAKSDRLNALDIIGAPLVVRVRKTDYNPDRENPLWIYFDGDNNRPFKPSKGMIRIIAACWGTESDNFIGRYMRLEFEQSVVYAGKEVGGIWIKAFSDIPESGKLLSLRISRNKIIPFPVEYLKVEATLYPQEKFDSVKQAMIDAMQSGKMSLPQVIAQCQKTGQLTPEQIKTLEQNAPIEDEGHPDEPQLNHQPAAGNDNQPMQHEDI